MPLHRIRVGVHARNAVHFTEHDYQLMSRARIETLKMMSQTDVSVFARLRRENPDLEMIVRLYDDRLKYTSRPSPTDFSKGMVPIINRLKPYTSRFEIHNEPNHYTGLEGWGASDENARAFRTWYKAVLAALRAACPWASFGFPGLALHHPHRDLQWLEICKDVIQQSDWLGCHCYWQYGNMLASDWGLRFKLYHDRFPDKRIEITEFGNSTPDLAAEEMARQYTAYYKELNKYPYLGSASAFIASSPDPQWALFVWVKEGGDFLPVVQAVGAMERAPVQVDPWPTTTTPAERTFPETGKTVRGKFLQFFDQYGLDICGYPIADQLEEDGVPAQYFQRLALEEYEADKVRPKMLGTEALELRARLEQLSQQLLALGGPAKPSIKDITEQLPVHKTKRFPSRALTDISQIVVHHTATDSSVTPKRLAEYRVSRDKPGIACHFVVAADGTIYQTNKLETESDHAGNHSRSSVGVVFPGNFTDTIPTKAQLKAGGQLMAWLLTSLPLGTTSDSTADWKGRIKGISELITTQSPGKQWLTGQRWKDLLLAEVDTALKAAGAEHLAVIASLRDQVAASEAQITTSEAQATALQAKVAALQAEINSLTKQPSVTPPTATTLATPTPTERTFPETGKKVRGEFLQFFDRYGLDICGYPITDQLEENGMPVQYFQRLALEEPKPGKIRLKLVGTEALDSRKTIAEQRVRLEQLSQQPLTTGGPLQPSIKDITDQLPVHKTKRFPSRALADISQIIVHHTATDSSVTPKRLAEHRVNLDKPGIAYHFVVAADGTIYQTNKLETESDHAGSHSRSGVGVVFPGSFTETIPTEAQIVAGGRLMAWLVSSLHLGTTSGGTVDLKGRIKGATELITTQSPGKQWLTGQRWKDLLLAEVDTALKAAGADQLALIASLRDQVAASEAEAATLHAQITVSKTQVATLQAQIATLEDQVATLQAEIKELKQQPSVTPMAIVTTPAPGPAKIARPPIRDLINTLPKHPTLRYSTRPLSDIQNLFIHHSAAPASVGPARIAAYHIKANAKTDKAEWPGIGYHFMIGADGTIYQGNSLETISYHTGGNNSPGVGICFLGRFMDDVPVPPIAQLESGAHLIAWLMQELTIDLADVKGHQEVNVTACPGSEWLKGNKWRDVLHQEIADVQKAAAQAASALTPGAKSLDHYMLFWQRPDTWPKQDWLSAQDYIGKFRPTVGFSVNDASLARYVTIVGGTAGISKQSEAWLVAAGCRVDRLAGKDEADTKRILDELVQAGKRFRSFEG